MSPELKQIVDDLKSKGLVNEKGLVKLPDLFNHLKENGDQKLLYELALILANKKLLAKVGLGWDDLPDINTLDAAMEADTFDEFRSAIIEALNERVNEMYEFIK